MTSRPDPTLPALHELGDDLLATTSHQRRLALLRPFFGLIVYIVAAYFELWLLTPAIVFLIFVAVVTVTHDVVHGSLGLSRRQTEWALFIFGTVLLESGHAYRITHHRHHGTFPDDDDPEGYPAKMSLLGALFYGPVFLLRLWWWAFNHTAGQQRLWLVVEGAFPVLGILGGLLIWDNTPAVLVYVVQAIVGSWVYPLLTVYLPHRDYGETPLMQTHTLRGRLIPALFLELTYHLEHHLYPQVPSHNLAKLSQRLDPLFDQAGVTRWHVI